MEAMNRSISNTIGSVLAFGWELLALPGHLEHHSSAIIPDGMFVHGWDDGALRGYQKSGIDRIVKNLMQPHVKEL
jgi:hypothetical protein